MGAKLVGIDFDNTIVCYDEVFARLAEERALMPGAGPVTKGRLRDHLRALGREDEWTALQGEAYGPELRRAKPFPGALEFIARCRREGVPVAVISHKTRRPFLGPAHDLHEAATLWLQDHGLADVDAFLELTKEGKLARIAAAGCTHFIDDLPEFLAEPEFPKGVERIWFAPDGARETAPFRAAASWGEIERWIFG